MIHILLATHGKFAEGLLDSAQMVYGKLAQTTFVSLRDEDGIDAFRLGSLWKSKSRAHLPTVFWCFATCSPARHLISPVAIHSLPML